jgi:hypothetical protein
MVHWNFSVPNGNGFPRSSRLSARDALVWLSANNGHRADAAVISDKPSPSDGKGACPFACPEFCLSSLSSLLLGGLHRACVLCQERSEPGGRHALLIQKTPIEIRNIVEASRKADVGDRHVSFAHQEMAGEVDA